MRTPGVLVIAILVAACAATPLASSAPPEGTPLPSATPLASASPLPTPPAETTAPSAEPTSPTSPPATATPTATDPIPSPTADAALVDLAVEYARRAGFDLARDPDPKPGFGTPMFDDQPFTHVALLLAGKATARLDVFVDVDGSIRVAEREERPADHVGSISRAAALDAAARAFRDAGVDPSSGTLHVAQHIAGSGWYITLDRRAGGHPIANHPMWWGIAGDHAYVELAEDGRLVQLYAIRPERHAVPADSLGPDALDGHLARIAERSRASIAALHPDLLWIRRDGDVTLSLDFCATDEQPLSWQTWCVDPRTGEPTATAGAVTDVGASP